jgi:DNA-binding NtrC family response regulator
MNGRWDVLIVDDEPVVRDAVSRVLSEAGLSAASVSDAEAALAHPALASCRLVICDMMLPGLSGLEALAAMRRRRPDLPVVMITGYATAEHESRSHEVGATAFLAKPFDDLELMTLVRRAMDPADVAGKEGRS